MKYRTAFQCPETGQTVIAHYIFGRVTIVPADDDDEPVFSETREYCTKYTGKICSDINDANEYIIATSDGQTYGFEESR